MKRSCKEASLDSHQAEKIDEFIVILVLTYHGNLAIASSWRTEIFEENMDREVSKLADQKSNKSEFSLLDTRC